VAGTDWSIDERDGELLIYTDVTGKAAKMGHRLTIAVRRWRAAVSWSGEVPVSAEVTVDVESLDVLDGEGGLKALSGPEKALARSNALKSLDTNRFPQIRFDAAGIEADGDGYRLTGTLQIHGSTRSQVIDVHTTDSGDLWWLSGTVTVRQSDFGVRPYSMMMGAVRVADAVRVAFRAGHPKGS
jgi:polyisoprenoid-binding protein YceI